MKIERKIKYFSPNKTYFKFYFNFLKTKTECV